MIEKIGVARNFKSGIRVYITADEMGAEISLVSFLERLKDSMDGTFVFTQAQFSKKLDEACDKTIHALKQELVYYPEITTNAIGK
jgi:hypothetical protein